MAGLSVSDPHTFDFLTKSLDFQHQALAHGVAAHAEVRRKAMAEEREAEEKKLREEAQGLHPALPPT